MATNYIDIGITAIIIVVVLGIFYRALKEPIDLVLGWIKRLLIGAKDKIADSTYSGETQVIRYG